MKFNKPQSFSKFRQIEIDSAQINVFQPLSDVTYLSKRFLLKRFLNLKDNEILENERLWKEENPSKVKASDSGVASESNVDLGDVGIGGGDDLDVGGEFDLDTEPDAESPADTPEPAGDAGGEELT